MTTKEKNIIIGTLYAKEELYKLTKNSEYPEIHKLENAYKNEYIAILCLATSLGISDTEYTEEEKTTLAQKYYYQK